MKMLIKEVLLAKKHDIKMIAAWAAENGIRGFDHLDPKVREQNRYKNNDRNKRYGNENKDFKKSNFKYS